MSVCFILIHELSELGELLGHSIRDDNRDEMSIPITLQVNEPFPVCRSFTRSTLTLDRQT